MLQADDELSEQTPIIFHERNSVREVNGSEKNEGHAHSQLSSFIDEDIIVVDAAWYHMETPQIKMSHYGISI